MIVGLNLMKCSLIPVMAIRRASILVLFFVMIWEIATSCGFFHRLLKSRVSDQLLHEAFFFFFFEHDYFMKLRGSSTESWHLPGATCTVVHIQMHRELEIN